MRTTGPARTNRQKAWERKRFRFYLEIPWGGFRAVAGLQRSAPAPHAQMRFLIKQTSLRGVFPSSASKISHNNSGRPWNTLHVTRKFHPNVLRSFIGRNVPHKRVFVPSLLQCDLFRRTRAKDLQYRCPACRNKYQKYAMTGGTKGLACKDKSPSLNTR